MYYEMCLFFDNMQALKMCYKHFQVYGTPFDCHLNLSGVVQVKVPNKPDGWTVHTTDLLVANGTKSF